MRLVTVKMPEIYIEGLNKLVEMGRYGSRSEAIRVAVRELLRRELWQEEEESRGFDIQTTFGPKVRIVKLS